MNLFTTPKIFLAAAIYALPLGAFAKSRGISVAREIASLDNEYSNLSLVKGMPAANAEYFAEAGIAFAPTVVNGKKYWASRTNFPGTLIWQSAFAFAAICKRNSTKKLISCRDIAFSSVLDPGVPVVLVRFRTI